MIMERTFSIIKPDGVKRNIIGKILTKIEESGLRVVATKTMHMSRREAEQFYAVHSARPFFGELCEYMTSAPVVVSVLEGTNAVAAYRELMGATDPSKATKGTIRADFGLSIGENTVHGSDSLENAAIEVAYFFSGTELVNSAK
ncbi:nucleoside-diphosphate kinase [Fluviispira sanaruensis]